MVRVYVWMCALFMGIGGMMFGYEVSGINGVKEMEGFRRTFNISYSPGDHVNHSDQCGSEDDVETSALLGSIVSVFSIGALVGALLSGLLSDFAGRRVTVFIGASLFVLGGTIQTSSFYLWMLFPGRIISGIGTGITLQACPLYVAEISPREIRGILVSMVNAVGATGLVAAVVLNSITERFLFGWRISLSLPVLFGSVLAAGALLLPETPRFLVKRHKDVKALKVLNRIHKDSSKAQSELKEIQLSIRNTAHQETCCHTLKYFFSWSIIQRVFIGFVLMLMTRITGAPVIAYYSVSIFCKVGVDGFIGSVALFVVIFISQVTAVAIIDKSGRKPMLLVGAIVVGTLLVVTGVLIQVFDLEGGEDLSTAQKVAGYFVIVLICLLMAVYVMTYSTCGWVVVSEIYPLRVRGIGAALSQLGWWSGTFLMGEVGPILLSSSLKTPGTFYLFAGMYSLAALHVLLFLPETKGRSLENIEWLFSEPWSRRVNVFYYIRCGCFCCGGRLGMGWTLADSDRTGVGVAAAADEEREVLQEPADQISLSSVDSSDPANNIDDDRTSETLV